jgi:hypothetical protein
MPRGYSPSPGVYRITPDVDDPTTEAADVLADSAYHTLHLAGVGSILFTETLDVSQHGFRLLIDREIDVLFTSGDEFTFSGTATEVLRENPGLPDWAWSGSTNKVLKSNGVTMSWATVAGLSAINDLSDVTITTVADNQVLQYDSATSQWINVSTLVASNIPDLSGTYATVVHVHTASNISDFSEAVDDRVGALLVAGSNVTLTYNDGANTLTIASSGGSGSPGGSDTEVQFNDGGAFAGDSGFTWNKTTNVLTVTGGFSGPGSALTSLDASNLGSGTVPTARLGSGSASGTTYLRGDQTWATVSAGPAGNDTEVQFNDGGVMAGDSGLTWNKTTNVLTTTGGFSGPGSALTALNASNLGSGTAPTARLGSGSATSSTFLRGDSTWATPTASDPSGWTTIVKSANQDVTNAGVTNDSDFAFAVTAGGHYMIEMDVTMSGNNTTGDYAFDFAVSAGTITGKGTVQDLSSAGTAQIALITAAAAANTTASIVGTPSNNLDDLAAMRMHFSFTASNTTTLTYRFGNSSVAAGRTSRTWKGSIMRWKSLD